MRKPSAIALGALAVGLALFVWTAPASAHAELESTNPAAGSSLAAPPNELTLTFGEELVPETVKVAITDDQGQLEGVTAATNGAVVTVPWPAEVGEGSYTVAYRVVSTDGHPVDGSFDFTVGEMDPSADASAAAAEAPYTPTGPEDGSVDWRMVIVVMLFGVAGFAALLIAGRKNARSKW